MSYLYETSRSGIWKVKFVFALKKKIQHNSLYRSNYKVAENEVYFLCLVCSVCVCMYVCVYRYMCPCMYVYYAHACPPTCTSV